MKLWHTLSLPHHIHIHAHLATRSAPFLPFNRAFLVFILIFICQHMSRSSLNLLPQDLFPASKHLFQGNCALSVRFLLNQRCEMLKQWCHQKSTCELKPRCVCAVR